MENKEQDNESNKPEMITDEETISCLFVFMAPFLFFGFLSWIVVPVIEGNASKWKIILFIASLALYGLLGGLAKAFESGLSGMNLLKTFGWSRKEKSKEDKET